MLSLTRTFQRLRPSRPRRAAPATFADPLDEFAPELAESLTRLPSTPRAALAQRSSTPGALTPPPPRLLVRMPRFRPVVPWRRLSLAAMTIAAIAVPTVLLTPDGKRRSPAAERAADAAAPTVDAGDAIVTAAAIDILTPFVVTVAASVPETPAPEVAPREETPPSRWPMTVEPEAPAQFAVRSTIPQIVFASPSDPGASSPADQPPAADAPPRRVGSVGDLAVTTLGGATGRGLVALVLDVNEHGDVARVVVQEAVGVDQPVIDTVSAAARLWRYEPARRDGLPVPARVRVMVEMSGGN